MEKPAVDEKPVTEEEKVGESVSGEPKHKALTEEKEVDVEIAQDTKDTKIKQVASPFINTMKSWDDENLKVPEDIKNNLTDILKFEKPSKIQAYTIPMILGGENLIALAPTGCGKTGAYGVSSVMRVDRSIQKCQVICITHTRELCQQVFNVYQSICKGTGITLDNGLEKAANGQILVCHHGKLPALTGGRKPMDLSKLKVIVIDECDFFFADQKFI